MIGCEMNQQEKHEMLCAGPCDGRRALGAASWLGLSTFIHVALIGGLLLASRIVLKKNGALTTVTATPTTPSATAEPLLREVHFFDGTSYTDYRMKREGDIAKKKTAGLLKTLQGLSIGGAAPTARAQTLQTAADAAARAAGTESTADAGRLTNAVAGQRFRFEARPIVKPSQRAMSDRERAELKRKFRALETELRKLYAKALNDDPHLELTVSFEAQVLATGYLSVASFKAAGNYRPESLAMFRQRMAELIGQVFVAQDLSGALVRGESVFTR